MNVQTKIQNPKGEDGYETDFALWALKQARLIEEGRFAELDIANLVDEVESLGRSQKAELRNRLATLIEHLLKYEYGIQRDPSHGWLSTINRERYMIGQQIKDSPSLMPLLESFFEEAWKVGLNDALNSFSIYERDRYETYKLELPSTPSFDVEQALERTFLPERES